MRFTESDLKRTIRKAKFGIASSIGKGSNGIKTGCTGTVHDVEPAASDELEGPKGLQVNYTGKVRVRIKFYRHRLADYSRAISEKALIDCLQYAGLIRGDSEKEIWLEDEGQVKVDNKADERTEITLEYLDVDFDNFWVENERTDGR